MKTGTLTTTDGGVAVLAGLFDSPDQGPVLFCVAAERAGSRLRHWRSLEQSWVLDLLATVGGAHARPCPPPLPFSDTLASAEVIADPAG